jgi:transcriptional regulator with XRE-family HTH domain
LPRPNENSETTGARLKRLRQERGLSQRDLSSPGVSYAYISRIEAGARRPSVKALRQLARKLNVSAEYLETGRDSTSSEERELRLSDAELALRLKTDAEQAESDLSVLVAEAEAAGDGPIALRARLALGFAASQRGKHLEAVELIEAVVRDGEVDPAAFPDVYAALCQSYVALGVAERAVGVLERCLEQISEADQPDVQLQVRYATYLSYALSDVGDFRRAGEVVKRALADASIDPDPYTQVRLHWSMARIAGMQGDTRKALRSIRRAIVFLEATDNTVILARAHIMAAGAELTDENASAGRVHIQLAEQLLGPTPEVFDLGILRVVQARLAVLEGDGVRGLNYAQEAIDTLGKEYGSEQGEAVWALAQALALHGEPVASLDAYRRAVDLLAVHGRRAQALQACREYGEALHQAGNEEEAERAFARAHTIAAQLTQETRAASD